MKVSVLMPTYQHEAYIAKAIESFLLQEFDKPMQLLISDDNSQDNTALIAKQYELLHPDRIKVFVQVSNLGLMKNYQFLIAQASGEYYAILESDDLWISKDKIKKQVGFLDHNPNYSLSFSNWFKWKGEEYSEQKAGNWYNSNPEIFYQNLLLRNLIKSPTVIFRASFFHKYSDINEYIKLNFNTFDYPVWLSLAKFHPFHYLQEATSAYRYVPSSLSNNKSIKNKLLFEDGIHEIRAYIINKFGKGKLSIYAIGIREIIVKARHILRIDNGMKAIMYFFVSYVQLLIHLCLGKKTLFKP